MKRSTIFLLASSFCLFTSRAGDSYSGAASYTGSQTSYTGGKTTYTGGQTSYTGAPTYEEEYEDEEQYSYTGGQTSYTGGKTSYTGGNSSYTGGKTSYTGGQTSYTGGKTSYTGGNSSYTGGQTSYTGGKTSYTGGQASYTGGKTSYGGGNSSYTGGKTSYTGGQPSYGGNHYEEEEQYHHEEEEHTYSYSGAPSYEEEYEEYDQAHYDYTSGSYGGDNSVSYGEGNTSNGYGSNKGYSGSYDSSKPSETPTFPTTLLTGFVVDIHFLAGDTTRQYIAYHYCSDLFPGYTQCAIYNGTASNSRLVATEIVVSAEIFATLPLAERKLYHSHAYSAKNGLLVIPGLTGQAELQAMQGVMNTYGKVVDYWHSYQNFPLGAPQLAYGLADDSQLDNTIINEMDKALNLGTTWLERKKQRAGLKDVTIIEGANDYLTSGVYPQYVIKQFNVPKN